MSDGEKCILAGSPLALGFGMAALGLGRAGSQAPQPRSGAPEAQGLTARTSPKPPSFHPNATQSDAVRQIKSRILHVNYGWEWDLAGLKEGQIRSEEVSRPDLIVRWGGGRRLSGFLPVQSVYADFYVVDDYWPDFKPEHLDDALDWFKDQDQTLGG